MKKLMILAWIFILTACSNTKQEDFSLIDHIPENSELVVLSPNLKQLLSDVKENTFFAKSGFPFKDRIKKELAFLPYLNLRNQTGIAFSDLKNTFNYSLITQKDSMLIPFDSIKNKSIESIRDGNLEYKKISLENSVFYLRELGNTVIISNSEKSLGDKEDASKSSVTNGFKEAYQASDPKKTSVFLNHKAGIFHSVFKEIGFPNIQAFAGWSVLDLDINPSEIRINGVSLTAKTTTSPGMLQNSRPRVLEIGKVCPKDFISLFAFSLDSSKENQESPRDSIEIGNPLLDHIQEIARVNLTEGNSLVLNAIEIEAAKEQLAGTGEQIEDFRGKPVFKVLETPTFEAVLTESIDIPGLSFYTILDHFIIFAPEISILQKHISSFLNSNTISSQLYFSDLMNSLSSESSMLFVTRNSEFSEQLSSGKNSNSFKLNRNSLSALQFIMERDYAHVHGAFSNTEANSQNSNGAEQVSSFKLEASLATKPAFFKNHRTDQLDIAVQDENNSLYLLSNKGNIFWKKDLNSKITSEIYQVDLFRNGNLQLAFSTGYNLEVIDRVGNRVKPFPITFNQPLTQPLSVFDYDNNRNYRFVLTQNNRLYMVGPKGKGIRGFKFEKAGSEIVLPPKHIRLGTKDYILVAEQSGRLNILSRQGDIRVPVSENIEFSDNNWYGYKDSFVSSSTLNDLIKISQQGKLSKENLGLAENNRIVAKDDLLVYLNENELNINGSKVELDFGLYTDPQLFEIKGKEYIAITDLQAQKVFVFNSKAELLEGFPVYGTSQVDIANADLDRRLELIVRGEENELILYKL
ncbi:hypothetical protein E0K83_16790 [Gramella sp. BOM4]|nr:hypothetical protein [Christiangramia bathymodioli]